MQEMSNTKYPWRPDKLDELLLDEDVIQQLLVKILDGRGSTDSVVSIVGALNRLNAEAHQLPGVMLDRLIELVERHADSEDELLRSDLQRVQAGVEVNWRLQDQH